MKKNSFLYNGEIDLIVLLKIIWNGKIKLLSITIISLLIGLGYNSQIPNNYLNSLTISPSSTTEFLKINNFQNLIKSNQSNQSNQLYLDRFITELADYEEFLAIVKNTKKSQENFLKLQIEDQEIELLKYAKLLAILNPKKKGESIQINLKWHNTDEAKNIFQDTINLTLINLEKSIYEEFDLALEGIYDFNQLDNLKRLDYLKQQRQIAKELNISDISDIPYGYTGEPFYLRGYVAIDKEIQVIKNSLDEEIKFLKTEINSLKKENIKWIQYDIDLIEKKSLKNTNLILMLSILLGLIGGVFFVLISNTFQSHTESRKIR